MSIKPNMKLFKRQKVLLALLQSFGGELSRVDLQKYLFLFTQTCQKEKSYEFVPFKFGCFSFQSYADRRRLIELGALIADDGWKLSPDYDFLLEIGDSERHKVKLFSQKYKTIKGDDLVKEVYKNFPYYAINSEIAARLMTKSELEKIDDCRPQFETSCFFTIGYEGQSFENYLNRLIENDIRTLVDVRSNPLSRKYGFSRKTLSETLEKLNIEYIHRPELGIISDKRKELKTTEDYNSLFADYENTVIKDNQDALVDLCEMMSRRKRVAITCFEHDSRMCHRGRVAKALQAFENWEFETRHI